MWNSWDVQYTYYILWPIIFRWQFILSSLSFSRTINPVISELCNSSDPSHGLKHDAVCLPLQNSNMKRQLLIRSVLFHYTYSITLSLLSRLPQRWTVLSLFSCLSKRCCKYLQQAKATLFRNFSHNSSHYPFHFITSFGCTFKKWEVAYKITSLLPQ